MGVLYRQNRTSLDFDRCPAPHYFPEKEQRETGEDINQKHLEEHVPRGQEKRDFEGGKVAP